MNPAHHLLSRQRPPLLPEIALWLLRPDVDLERRCDVLTADDHAPYWAFCWGSGQALARHLLDHPHEVAGRRVVDFGTGSGVVAIAAAMAGAREVIAVDIDPHARGYAERNARDNAVALTTAAETPDDWEVLLASDVLYETHNLQWIEQMAARGRRVLLSDPRRHADPRPKAEPIARHEARTLPDVDHPLRWAEIYAWGPEG